MKYLSAIFFVCTVIAFYCLKYGNLEGVAFFGSIAFIILFVGMFYEIIRMIVKGELK